MPLISAWNRQNAFTFNSSGDVEDVVFEAAGLHAVNLSLYAQWSSTNITGASILVGGHCRDTSNDFFPFDDFSVSGPDFSKSGSSIVFPGSAGEYRSIVTFKNPPKWLVLRMDYSAFTSGLIIGGLSWSRS